MMVWILSIWLLLSIAVEELLLPSEDDFEKLGRQKTPKCILKNKSRKYQQLNDKLMSVSNGAFLYIENEKFSIHKMLGKSNRLGLKIERFMWNNFIFLADYVYLCAVLCRNPHLHLRHK